MLKTVYWFSFLVSIFVLINSLGLMLMFFGIPILILLFYHIKVGLNLASLVGKSELLLLSSLNLLLFALIRNDGAHTLSTNGLNSLLQLFNRNWGYDRTYENAFMLSALASFIIQIYFEIRLVKALNRNLETKR